jgi:hypothetical protein
MKQIMQCHCAISAAAAAAGAPVELSRKNYFKIKNLFKIFYLKIKIKLFFFKSTVVLAVYYLFIYFQK